jgi:SAM-dependent methyltransferase
MSRSEAQHRSPRIGPGTGAAVVSLMKAAVPGAARSWLRAHRHLARWPPVGRVRFGGLRRTEPISRVYGFDRGVPTDRYYIEGFLEERCDDIRGRVLEVADNAYTMRFGGERVTHSDVLDIAPTRHATLVGDLATGDGVPRGVFDCIILTQVLHLIYEKKSAIDNACQALKPGGVLLATVPGISQICRDSNGRWHDCWRFTAVSAQRLFEEVFGPGNVDVQSHGNVLTAMAFLHGLAVEELKRSELEHNDPDYQVSISIRASRPGGS